MVDEALRPRECGVALGRKAGTSTSHPGSLPIRGGEGEEAHGVVFAEPVGLVEGRIGEDVVGARGGMEVAGDGVGLFGAKVVLDDAEGEVHPRKAAHAAISFEGSHMQGRPRLGPG